MGDAGMWGYRDGMVELCGGGDVEVGGVRWEVE